ncbi:uncharacterized protein ABDE67_012913 isoform 1-T2 [Symphorus nematophorus]
MDTVREVLLDQLRKLKAEEFKNFKFHLEEYGRAQRAVNKDFPVILTSELENADRWTTVHLIYQRYSGQTMKVAREVFRRTGRNDLGGATAPQPGSSPASPPVNIQRPADLLPYNRGQMPQNYQVLDPLELLVLGLMDVCGPEPWNHCCPRAQNHCCRGPQNHCCPRSRHCFF